MDKIPTSFESMHAGANPARAIILQEGRMVKGKVNEKARILAQLGARLLGLESGIVVRKNEMDFAVLKYHEQVGAVKECHVAIGLIEKNDCAE